MTDRKAYWNEQYLKYWESRVQEANAGGSASRVIENDPLTLQDQVIRDIFLATPPSPGSILEVGCAWGRWFPVFLEQGLQVHGIDISPAMIARATELWNDIDGVVSVQEAEAEHLPFPDGTFDNVACIAVFDATRQHEALRELLRVARQGARIIVTGKNDTYHADDQAAFDAEIGARAKGHPNFFTDTKAMLRQLHEQGHRVLRTLYFERRGDFGVGKAVTTMPARFYEFYVEIEKMSDIRDFTPFSAEISHTCAERQASR